MRVTKTLVGKWIMVLSNVPIIVVGVLITLLSSNAILTTKEKDTMNLLKGSANELKYSYELKYGDNISVVQKGDDIYFGDENISADYTIVDNLKSYNGVDYTFFYKDERISTTLVDEKGNRYINSSSKIIWENYVSQKVEYFEKNIVIKGEKYFGYYIPFYDNSGEVIGMCFAGCKTKDVYNDVRQIRTFTIILCSILCCASVIASIFVSAKYVNVQNKAVKYLQEITDGKYNHKLDEDMLSRKDEYGIIFNTLVKLNDSTRKLILCDSLTEMYNRRAALQFLNQYVVNANKSQPETFTLSICDIDFFKSVNDNYGHNCGDAVLKLVSSILNEKCGNDGFVSRWGGEEFLIVLKMDIDETIEKINLIADAIREAEVNYDGKIVKVTMTFGVTEYIPPENIDYTISRADRLLYIGKDTGRNKVVS